MSEISEEATNLIDNFECAVEDAVSDYTMACGASQKHQARRNLEDYIAELEALVDELVNIGDNLFDSLNPIAWKHEWLDKWWKLSSCRRGERE